MSTNPIERVPVEMKNGLVQLTNLDEAFRFAKAVHASGLCPASFKSPEAILIACQMGAELGLTPMMSLKTISVVNGRPAIGGKDMPAIVLRSGLLESWEESIEGSGDDLRAVCKVKRRGIESERIATFSVRDARRAGLWGTQTWSKYPEDMLRHRARARAFQLFADVLAGLPVAEDILPEKAQPAPTGRKPDPLLQQAQGSVVEDEESPVVGTTGPDKQVQQSPAEPVASEGAEATDPTEAPVLAPPQNKGAPAEAKAPSDELFPEPTIPKHADLIASLEQLSAGIAGRKLPELRGRVEQAYQQMPDELWKKALWKCDQSEGDVKNLDGAGLRKLLCECVAVVKEDSKK